MAFAPAPLPKSALGYHRILSPTAAVKVSPLCLGGMNFGDAWKDMMGDCSQETTEEILDYFYSQGGNFIDTANNYQRGESEQWIGNWMKKRDIRDQIVLSTKYATAWRGGAGVAKEGEIIINTGGLGSKSLRLSLNRSLKKLQTDYIDILYIHWWDYTTSIPELMHTLNDTIRSGKVLYLGISDTPAWIVSKANQYARDHGLAQFSVYQGLWNAAHRDIERDIIPMTIDEGMALQPWAVLGEGRFKTEEQRAKQVSEGQGRGLDEQSESVKAVVKVLDRIATEKDTLVTSVALAFVLHKQPYVFPIVGGRKLEHLKANIEALSLELSGDDMRDIEGAAGFEFGWPLEMIGRGVDDSTLNAIGGVIDAVKPQKAIAPRKM